MSAPQHTAYGQYEELACVIGSVNQEARQRKEYLADRPRIYALKRFRPSRGIG
jgi:hypothetical protein